ncbi:MAG: hypothetical protein P4L85_22585 [Paludisphaera borealis]|uniref:hypothetical protein n=1 Tax=Paludisphaera borealis TaxID=1387353 RepID=UPI00283FF182|nr:hypothetical protein [Paludisphaera borealis]MDR3622155.1 hypothetical protein [Paludisphaera borealis]
MPSTERESGADSPSSTLAVEEGVATIRPIRIWIHVIALGIVAGVVAWLAGEACLNIVQPRRHAIVDRGIALNVSDRRGEANATAANAGLAFILLGGLLGAALGAAGGRIRGSNRAAGSAAAVGLGAGALGAALVSLAILPAYNAYRLSHPDEASRDLILPLLVHVGVWATAGAAGGLALGVGLGLGDRRAILNVVLGGLIGAAVGATVFELVGAFAFPTAETARYVSRTGPTRLLARLLVCVCAAGGVAAAAVDALGRRSDVAA